METVRELMRLASGEPTYALFTVVLAALTSAALFACLRISRPGLDTQSGQDGLCFEKVDTQNGAARQCAITQSFSERLIPGPHPSADDSGNFTDMAAAGGLHPYLLELHRIHGPIAAFWWGPQRVVSVASVEGLRDMSKMYDRPKLLFAAFEPMIGPCSVQYANGDDARTRRRTYLDPAFSHDAMKDVELIIRGRATAMVKRWHASIENLRAIAKPAALELDLEVEMMRMSIESIARAAFGAELDHADLEDVATGYSTCWHDMELRIDGENPLPGSARELRFQQALHSLHAVVRKIVNKDNPASHDTFMSMLRATGASEAHLCDEAVTMLVGGSHTTGYTLTWALYALATHPQVQVKARTRIRAAMKLALSLRTTRSEDVLPEVPYITAIVNETLRWAVLSPWAARVSDEDVVIAGYPIPAHTPIIQALGCVLNDPLLWPHPEQFDPDRFSEECAAGRASLAFAPFGFAGKRICPGKRLAYAEAEYVLALILRDFELTLSAGHPVVSMRHGLVTSPSIPIRITLAPVDEKSYI